MDCSMADISKLCRLCLKSDNVVRPIFEDFTQTKIKKWVVKDISNIIYECTQIMVDRTDGPTNICRECLQEIISIIRFRQKCFENNKHLHETLKLVGTSTKYTNPMSTQNLLITFIDYGDGTIFPTSLKDKVLQNELTLSENMHTNMDENCKLSQSSFSESENVVYNQMETVNKDDKTIHQPIQYIYKLKSSKSVPGDALEWKDKIVKLKKKELLGTKAYRGLCHICGKSYQHLWVHFKSHYSENTDTCDVCGKGFKSKANLQLHKLTHKNAEYPCSVCNKKYRTKMRLQRHMRVHTGVRPFQCLICQKRFYTKYNLNVHMRSHTGDKPHRCNICEMKFTHSYELKNHSVKWHKS